MKKTTFIAAGASMLLAAALALPAAAQLPQPTGSQWFPDLGYLPNVGDLVKLANDHDPSTHADEAVYYIDADQKREAFPNRGVYDSWYRDFSAVKTISAADMARIPLAGNVRYRPGSTLVKITSVPKVYAVEPGGVLRWVASEEVAKALYGPDWNKRVVDVPETLFTDYTEGLPLTVDRWPTGTIVRRSSDDALFSIDGDQKRHIPPDAVTSLRIEPSSIVDDTSGALADYGDGADVSGTDLKFIDTGESFHIDTAPPPAFDFPTTVDPTVTKGQDATLYAFRLITGTDATFRGLTFTIDGGAADGKAFLSDLRVEDGTGDRVFGTVQLPDASGHVTVAMSGASGVAAGADMTYTLVAHVASDAPGGAKVTVSVDRSTVSVADPRGVMSRLWPMHDWPTTTVQVQ